MWRKALACLYSIVLGAAALPGVDSPGDPGQSVSAEDYAIFVAATSDLFANNKIEKVIFLDHTSVGFPPGMAAMTQFGGKAQELLREVPKDAKHAFDLRNKSPLMLDSSKFDLPFQVTLLTAGDAENVIKAGWKHFHKRYPKSPGITLLSLPGINAERDRALQYVGNSCDSLCGEGWLLLLVKENGQWKVFKKTVIWVS